jgi:phosphatidylglycerophosphate synthase
LILAAWFCDRIDGPLSRLQNVSGPLGAWIDANVDEFVDLGLHVVTAAVAARLSGSPLPWFLLIGFLVGKYLLMHGLASDDDLTLRSAANRTLTNGEAAPSSWWRTLYHLPANADVRAHLLIIAVAFGWPTWELAFVAVYYNLRWPLRYFLLLRRFRALAPGAAS